MEWKVAGCRPGENIPVDVGEVQLRSTKHRERGRIVDGAPREVHEPVTSTAVGERSAEVEPAVARDRGGDLELPCHFGGISWDQAVRVPAPLNPNVHVLETFS